MLITFLVATLLRAGWGTVSLIRADDVSALQFPDEQQYWLMATSLHDGQGLQDELGFRATRMPLYPGLLSIFAGLEFGVAYAKGLHWLLGGVAAALTAGLAGSMFDRRVGLVAGLIVAVDPFLVFFSSLLLTETLYLVVSVGIWWLAWVILRHGPSEVSRGHWLGLGVMAALCVYTRESSLGLVLLVGVVLLIRGGVHRRTIGGTALAATVVVGSLVPWAVRNHRVTDDWCWLTHRGGISLYDGVGPQATGESNLGGIKAMPAVADLNEVAWNRYFLDHSFKAIRDDPLRILKLAGVKLSRMWNPIPNAREYRSTSVRLVAAAWTIPFFMLGMSGVVLLFRDRAGGGIRVALFLLLPALYLSAVHSVFVGSVRYRLGAAPMIAVLAALALVRLVDARISPAEHGGSDH